MENSENHSSLAQENLSLRHRISELESRLSAYEQKVLQHQELEKRLRESEQKYKVMGEAIPFGVWLCNERGGMEYVSDSFLKLLNMTLEEVQEFGWTRKLPAEDLESMMKKWMHCVYSGEPWETELRIVDAQGKMNYILTRGHPIRDEQGNLTCWVGTNLDITDRKQAEIHLNLLKKHLELAVKKRTRKIQEQSRNLRLMSTQLSLAEEKERRKLSEELHDYLAHLLVDGKMITERLKKLSQDNKFIALINEILYIFDEALSYTRSLITDLSPGVLYQCGVLDAIKVLTRQIYNKYKVRIHFVNSVETIPLSEDHAVLLYQAIQEMLNNIVKHAGVKEAFIYIENPATTCDNHFRSWIRFDLRNVKRMR